MSWIRLPAKYKTILWPPSHIPVCVEPGCFQARAIDSKKCGQHQPA